MKYFSDKLKQKLYPIFSSYLKTAKHNGFSSEKNILITGTARSGTTWLAEMLSNARHTAVLYEPLHIRRHKDLKNYNMGWTTPIPPGTDDELRKQLFHDLLNGRRITPYNLRNNSLSCLVRPKRWIIKFVRANLLIHWLTEQFDIPTPIYIIRHPCAVVASQMKRRLAHQTITPDKAKFEWLHDKPYYIRYFLKKHPEFVSLAQKINTWEEILAFHWGVSNYSLIDYQYKKSLFLVSYEDLVEHTVPIVSKLKAHYGLQAQQGHAITTQASSTAMDKQIDRSQQLGKWEEELSAKQIERILNVVKRLQIPFYSENVMPDTSLLNRQSLLSL